MVLTRKILDKRCYGTC